LKPLPTQLIEADPPKIGEISLDRVRSDVQVVLKKAQ